RLPQQLGFIVQPQAPMANTFLTGTIAGWRGLPEVWIMERSPDWSTLESFTPPPPPPLGPQFAGLWSAPTIRLAGTETRRYILLTEPYYVETLLEAPPIGDVLNSVARSLISDWLAYAPPFTVLPQPSQLAGRLAPPRTDKPPDLGLLSQRWIQWEIIRERYD